MEKYVAQYTIVFQVSKEIMGENFASAMEKAATILCSLGIDMSELQLSMIDGSEIVVDVDDVHVTLEDMYEKAKCV
ncbi:hypothetical protein HPJ92_01925 [Anoxybacillus flavithermus]|uniref:hypothetical protein n=1 Tax=Anoxybacillus flavithermus TaxID=33934 RepID=UPI001866D104|nr:hypothetical protein [Anoxybacillus flavithermus]MBE2914733.1 hypothetical protein [Anoxybacillus flavithermus]MBE2931316.1 hypothetical protein [Anoxybacillus flavithermus]